ncbi:MAG: ABC transporter permease [Tepidisphaerales bacterium]
MASVVSTPSAGRSAPHGGVQRQITLPLSKAVEIAYKSIRLRLTRSLVVTSGIVLALAFLMSILVSEAVVSGLREWVARSSTDPKFVELRQKQVAIEERVAEKESRLRSLAAANASAPVDAAAFRRVTGSNVADLRKKLGGFPLSNDDMQRLATAEPLALKEWLDAQLASIDIRQQLSVPQQIEAQMKASGVPSTPQEIENSRIQKRWLVGLALLVAFVGILNAMLMSVTERFREIGTMKCLGALDSFIIKLFLIESLFQGVTGTLIGVSLGLALSLAASAASYGSYTFINLPWGEVVLYFAVCTLIGVALTVAAAVYPAWQAARMQPIEAMRVDT